MSRHFSSQWHEAYAICPCGCGYDADFLIDDDTNEPFQWRCNVTGESGTVEKEPTR